MLLLEILALCLYLANKLEHSSCSDTVQANPDKVSYNVGEIVELSAVADPGWAFESWSGDLMGSANPATLVMDRDKLVTATFVVDSIPPVISNV